MGSLHELCETRHRFEVDNILHEYVSQHEQRHAGTSRTTRALLLQRTLPRLWLDAHAVRGMVGLWRDCVVVCGECVEPSLLVAFMCAGAKAVVAPALDSRGPSLLDEVRHEGWVLCWLSVALCCIRMGCCLLRNSVAYVGRCCMRPRNMLIHLAGRRRTGLVHARPAGVGLLRHTAEAGPPVRL